MADPIVTPDHLRDESDLIAQQFPDGEGEEPGAKDEELTRRMQTAVALLQSLMCGRRIDSTLPSELHAVARRAVALKVEQLVERRQIKRRRSAIRSGNLRSISAGSWSESYFGPDEAAKARVLDPDPEMHEALWALLDDDCRMAWQAIWSGEEAPAAAIQVFDWNRAPGGY